MLGTSRLVSVWDNGPGESVVLHRPRRGGGCTSYNCMTKHNHSYTTYSFPISLGYKVYRMSFGWLVEGKNIGIDRYPIWAGSISSLWEAGGGRYGSSGLSNRSNIRWVGK